ncbi:hypothetical protein [Bradyrhizobium sp. Ghvi]|uniref:hypothetical protein n=1 Tax=Bradyrhizobium sp. Ghvi TaxID=1855319 RepID=UPI000B82690F|nr:hypothetical protein [Bradyrhizobium sp. Ghvi]
MAKLGNKSSTAARISHDAPASLTINATAPAARISHDAAARASVDASARISHDAAAIDGVVVPLSRDAAAPDFDPANARISHDAAANATVDAAARISHDAPAITPDEVTSRISHDTAVTASDSASVTAPDLAAASASTQAAPTVSPFRQVLAWAKSSASRLIRNPSVRRCLVLAKTLGIAGVLAGGIQQVAATHAPQWTDPAAEYLYLRQDMAAFTNEPGEQAPGQGKINTTIKFKYEFRISNLDSAGVVRGRFRGYSEDGKPDPRWWYVTGRSDGKRAMLTYRNEKGDVMGELSLLRSKDGSVWAGHLVGIDRSISDADLVQSPIIVAQSDYDLNRLKSDDFLNESPVLVKGYTH